MVVRILLGIAIMLVGFHMVWKTESWLRTFGRIPSAEKYLGLEGGSRLFYKLLGVFACFIGMFVATNLIQSMINDVFGSMFSSLG